MNVDQPSLPTRILVPTDFSASADAALDYTVKLASRLDAHVYVLHVFELPSFAVADAALLTSELAEGLERDAVLALDKWLERHDLRGLDVTKIVRCGEPRSQIEATARTIGADLLCMGTHGRRGFARALLGSVTELVVRTSTVPVLTMHAVAA